MWPDFNNPFTLALSDKLQKRQKPTLPPHLMSIATLQGRIMVLPGPEASKRLRVPSLLPLSLPLPSPDNGGGVRAI